MSELSKLPAQAVLPLAAYNLDSLRRSAQRFDQQYLECDFSAVRSIQDILPAVSKAFGNALGLTPDVDIDLPTLYHLLTQLKTPGELPGVVVILQNIPDEKCFARQEREALLDVFREAADFFYEKDTAFRVFYSVKKPAAVSPD